MKVEIFPMDPRRSRQTSSNIAGKELFALDVNSFSERFREFRGTAKREKKVDNSNQEERS